MAARQPRFNQQVLIDTTPLPDSIPKVPELGASSAPLLSASFFIGARCRSYNDDYMLCKTEAHGKGELDCMREGRKVTRCAASVLEDIRTHCLDEFRSHWQCLENNNQQMWHCRRPEMKLNSCVFDKLVRFVRDIAIRSHTDEASSPQKLEKVIPGTPENETPVHLRKRQIYSQNA
ncbi:MAG: hypothetical protein M1817_003719 [Caeruleum heppii]|nr:MAG: hypothetical protein M1817_003719 [Caeruleum heppii]